MGASDILEKDFSGRWSSNRWPPILIVHNLVPAAAESPLLPPPQLPAGERPLIILKVISAGATVATVATAASVATIATLDGATVSIISVTVSGVRAAQRCPTLARSCFHTGAHIKSRLVAMTKGQK